MTPPATPSPWLAFREKMPVTANWAYFDHAAIAPLSGPGFDIYRAWLDDITQHGDAHWLTWAARAETTRRLAAQLIHANPDEIALVRNTTEGMNLVAEGFPWRPGENVVVPADEFPSNLYPWLNLAARGVEVRQVAAAPEGITYDAIETACDAKTRIVAVSWVGYGHGQRLDPARLVEIAHRRGALLFLDAIQGLGVFPLDVQAAGVDFLAADGHKWLLGPEGAGLFYLKREHLDRLRPLGVGWNSVEQAANFDDIRPNWKRSAARYEGGTANLGAIAALGASLELLLEHDIAKIAERLVNYTDQLVDRLQQAGATVVSPRDAQRSSGIVSFTWPNVAPAALRTACLRQGVTLSCRAGRLRASPHVYNNADDLDRLIDVLKSF